MPTLFGVGALVLAVMTVALDDSLDFEVHGDRFLVGDTDTALTLTSVVATGMLAFLGIVFATTLVAIQLAASQYSPRAVRVFVRSRLTKISLGMFVATFVFSIVTLIAIRSAPGARRGFTPVLSTSGVAVLVIATLVAFLVFANGTARLLRVQYLVERIAEETRPALVAAFPTETRSLRCERARRHPPDRDDPRPRPTACSTPSTSATWPALAARLDGWIELTDTDRSTSHTGHPSRAIHHGGDRRPAVRVRHLRCVPRLSPVRQRTHACYRTRASASANSSTSRSARSHPR